ncbi:MAG: hypothetical protein JRF53_00570 [Deltaproteobacteria bacterium]|nr:hypothetical protein [Deltaproteobacteria bacterium]
MPTAENAIFYYEAGQDPTAMVALTDDGDHITFNSAANFWSNRDGYSPVVRPNGLMTGGAVIPGVSGSDDKIDVAALICYLAGVETDVGAAADEDITRGVTTDTHIINSVTIDSGGSVAIVAGTDHTEFSTTRGANGGPPWIPTGSIEIAQVRLTSVAAAVVTADEIFQVVGTHVERWDYPTWDEKRIRVTDQVVGYAGIDFISALPLIHSDDAGSTTAGKKVYAEYYEPIWAELPRAENFVPPENSHSVSSKQVYGGTIGASTASLGQGSFTFYPLDGITDNLIKLANEILLFKFKQNRLKDPYIICQGKLGIAPTYPAGDNLTAGATISAEEVSQRAAS